MTSILQASVPRSGNHLLLKLLWDAIPFGRISSCEFYTTVNCCKQIPCLRQEKGTLRAPDPSRFGEGDNIFIHKTHDLKLSDLPTQDYGAIYQLRSPHNYILSHLIWQMSSAADFNIGSAIAFAHNCAIYYIRMYIKWAVLYSDFLVVPPIFYESLLTNKGKSQVLRDLSREIGFNLTDDQIQYSLKMSEIHSHSGSVFTSSLADKARSLIGNSLVLEQCASLARAIIQLLPTISTHYPFPSCEKQDPDEKLLPQFEASIDPDEKSTSRLSIQLSGNRSITNDGFKDREVFIEGTGIGEAFPGGSYLKGSITILPIRIPRKSAIRKIEVSIKAHGPRPSDHDFDQVSASEIALIYLDKVIGWFKETSTPSVINCKAILDEPVIPSSKLILLALGLKPRTNLVSICSEERSFRFISNIDIRIAHQ